MTIFYEVATINDTTLSPPFAVVRLDTDMRVGDGCEAKVISLHDCREEAQEAAQRCRDALAEWDVLQ